MARLGCKCGSDMCTSDSPSPYMLDIYYASEIRQVLANDPDIKLHDFLMGWSEKEGCQKEYRQRSEPVEYWYCTECQRVYEVQAVQGGRWLRIYKRSDAISNADYSHWKLIYVMPDTETDTATEANLAISLADYLKQHDAVHYYLSPDETLALAVDGATSKPLFCYKLEDSWSPFSK